MRALLLILRALLARLQFKRPPAPPTLQPPTYAPGPALLTMPNPVGKASIQAILSVFETGKAEGDYAACAILKDGAGISYGMHQVTDGGGNLLVLMERYVAARGLYADQVAVHVRWIELRGSTHEDPDRITPRAAALMNVLAMAGDEDPIMRSVQDNLFFEKYYAPAARMAFDMGLTLPLSWAVIYDTAIQSGPAGVGKIRALFPEVPPSRGGADEKTWVRAYIRARRTWLRRHPNVRVRMTTARMDAMRRLADADNWYLERPFSVLGVRIETSE